MIKNKLFINDSTMPDAQIKVEEWLGKQANGVWNAYLYDQPVPKYDQEDQMTCLALVAEAHEILDKVKHNSLGGSILARIRAVINTARSDVSISLTYLAMANRKISELEEQIQQMRYDDEDRNDANDVG